jgi:hypothetical protein
MMTDRANEPQQYWYIRVPKAKFPESKFHFDEQVAIHWEDDQGNRYCDIGLIVGMQYVVQGNHPAQWYYRIRYLKCDHTPWLVGLEDDDFEEESCLVSNDSVI